VRPACRRFRQFMVPTHGYKTVEAGHELSNAQFAQ